MNAPVYGTLLALGTERLDTLHGPFTAHRFENLVDRRPMIVLTRGDVRTGEPLLARVHSSCVTSESLGGSDCDCAGQLSAALDGIARAGRGAVFYLVQEGRGAGFAAKARDRMLVQASGHRLTTFEAYEQMGLGRDLRRYDTIAFARRMLGITAPFTVLTNNPDKLDALESARVPVDGARPLAGPTSSFNVHYVDTKRRSGHALEQAGADLRPAPLPEPVETFEPESVAGDPETIRLASYLLPVGLDDSVVWLRVHAFFDVAALEERVVLVHGDPRRRPPLVAVHRESLFDRFPLRRPGPGRRRWEGILRAVATRGSGCVLFRSAEGRTDREDGTAADARLLARHVPEHRAVTLSGSERADTVDEALRSLGVDVEERVPLEEA